MTLRHLAIFIKVCEENGITAAAKKTSYDSTIC